MQIIKLLKEIVLTYAGPNAVGIVDLLHDKKNVNEFLIAKKLNLTINQTRNILYKLADEGLVSFIRKKDKKKGGWYTYFWTLNISKSLSRYKEKIESDINNLKSQLTSKKTRTFYFCKNCHIEYNEENALLNEYTCPECGEILAIKDPSEAIDHINKEKEKIDSLKKLIDSELELVNDKEGKSRIRKMKAEVKKKEEERRKKRKLKAKEREKEKKKIKPLKKKKKTSKK
ncbi:hypothetical protein J4408_00950 [Candidatus Pacearchaeota archaeon]|nr:hypothetical protein [Candidatus Pacearchaeota archaeon]